MKKDLNTRTRILLTVLPVAILPIIIITIYTATNFYNRTFIQNREFYRDIISQVTTNIDFYYNQYAISFADVAKSSIFQKAVHRPMMSSYEDLNFEIDGQYYALTMRDFLVSKFSGTFYLLELNREDTVNKRPYRCIYLTHSNITFDVEELKNDPVFLKMTENMTMEPLMATSKVLKGMEVENQVTFFCPYLEEGDARVDVIMIVIETQNFLHNLYEKNTRLRLGTLYMMDQFGNIQERNHPYIDDYYDYDKKLGRYILNPGDDPDDPYEGMSFAEYRMLNTDPAILQLPKIKQQIETAKEEGEPTCEIVTFKGSKYLSIISIAEKSQMQVIYFHPLRQLFAPIMKIIWTIIAIAVIISLLVTVISFFFSRYLTKPVIELTMATRKICNGNYEIQLVADDFFGEFVELSNSFNRMVQTMSDYRNNMEHMVHKRTEELHQTVEQLTEVNEQNKRELIMAQKIQSSLIPKVFPATKLLQFSSRYMPMEALGGDLYDVYQISDTVFSVMILDVCGHGVPAALITTMAKISFNANTKKIQDPGNVIFNVNNELFDTINGSGDYFTAFYGIIDMEKGMLHYSNAGHNTMFLSHADSTMDNLENNGPVVGVVKDLKFCTVSHPLKNGDRLILYTDGVIEARDEASKLYGEDRLISIIKTTGKGSVKQFIENVFSDLQNFRGKAPNSDDIALFAIDIIGIET